VLVLEQLGGPFSLTRRLQLSDDGRRLLVDLSVLDANGKPVTAHLEYAGVD
jgi:protocatechuate 3,4-dioxygenase beta subunit